MNKVLIIGLGLIGGSYAKGLSKKGYEVYAIDTNSKTIKYAIDNKIIKDGACEYNEEFIKGFDRIIFALTPKALLSTIENIKTFFKEGAIITDVTGIKEAVVLI